VSPGDIELTNFEDSGVDREVAADYPRRRPRIREHQEYRRDQIGGNVFKTAPGP
jgi:hypothetical protein